MKGLQRIPNDKELQKGTLILQSITKGILLGTQICFGGSYYSGSPILFEGEGGGSLLLIKIQHYLYTALTLCDASGFGLFVFSKAPAPPGSAFLDVPSCQVIGDT